MSSIMYCITAIIIACLYLDVEIILLFNELVSLFWSMWLLWLPIGIIYIFLIVFVKSLTEEISKK